MTPVTEQRAQVHLADLQRLVHREAVIRLLERSLALDPNQPEVARTLVGVKNAR